MALTLEQIKGGVSLLGLFERDGHVLKKTGPDTWKCRCPFHEERTGSCVVHDAKGFFKCFGCNARGTIFEYWALSRGLEKETQFAEVCRGLEELISGHVINAPMRAEGPAEAEPERPVPLTGRDLEKWREGCRFLALHRAEQEKIAEWRGYRVETVERLAKMAKLGLPMYFGKRLPAFAIEAPDEKGEPYLAGYHVRRDADASGKAMWNYVPRGIGAWPFVLGDPLTCKALVILEGQWDGVAFVDALGLGVPGDTQGESRGFAIMGVRGSTTWQKVLQWRWDEEKTQVWLYADSDEAGRKWLDDEEGFAWHLRRRCKALHAHVCEGQKDFNDLHRAACSVDREAWAKDLQEALRRQWTKGKRKRAYRPGKKGNRGAAGA